MFNAARNVLVNGGSFVVNADTSRKEVKIGRLLNLAAPHAVLNAGGRADDVRCYPGTREEVIGKIETWMASVVEQPNTNRIMWLSGPAGAGKSAICQTVAERCGARQQHAANFFFFRGDRTRNRAQPLVATLVYQLRPFYPMLDELLTNRLTADPLICKASIADQFLHLISDPMREAHQSTHEPIVLIIDGLDECDDKKKQDQILTALHTLVYADDSPFLVLIASRAEPHLIMSFNRLGTSVESLFLDDQYRPRDDIYCFVTAKFKEIKQLHHLRLLLGENWPAQADIDAITDKSSGQFIYAATAMRFIQYSSASPDLSLTTILKMQPTAGPNPLAQLDAIYSYVFSQAPDIRSVKIILCTYMISSLEYASPETKYRQFLELIGYKPVEIKSLFADLGAIIKVDANPVKLVFYHASLHDYLGDKNRSRDYYLDVGELAAEVSAICLRNFHDENSFTLAIYPLRFVKTTTTELSKSLLDAPTRVLSHPNWEYVFARRWKEFLLQLEKLYLKTDSELFHDLLQRWVHFAHLNKIDQAMAMDMVNYYASWYYQWRCRVERLKSVFNLG